jgi:REP element-mobilizing transposase RayT
MSRPLRIEFSGAVYHVTARGDRREPIYEDDQDRERFLAVLGQGMERFDAECLAYCLMGNHYHLVLMTREGNLSRLMRHLNGVYTQTYNRRHGKVGHLFQGRFKAILVDRDAYLLALCRYVECNPVAAGLVAQPQDWRWSSCRAHLLLDEMPPWLNSDAVLAHVQSRPLHNARERQQAARKYAELIGQPLDGPIWSGGLRQQIYLGDEGFVQRMQGQAEKRQLQAPAVPRAQRATWKTWSQWLAESPSREQALLKAYRMGGMTMTELAAQAGLSITHVSRLIKSTEKEGKWET